MWNSNACDVIESMKRKLIFHIGHSAGFYSEFNNMVLAILYCQRHGIEFELYSKDANFGQGKGWTDFFEPFCKETTWLGHHYINQRYSNPVGGKRKVLMDVYKTYHPNNFLTPDLWPAFRHIDNEMTTKDVMSACRPIVDEIYRFNGNTCVEVDSLMRKISIGEPYIGFHIRGGDKTAEHDILNIEQYISVAEKLSEIRTAFVYTDDYSFITLFRQNYPYWNVHTLTTEDEHGYIHQKFLQLTLSEKRNKLLKMFASMEYLRKSEYAVCTYSSNPGMFLGMSMGERAIGIDYNDWLIW